VNSNSQRPSAPARRLPSSRRASETTAFPDTREERATRSRLQLDRNLASPLQSESEGMASARTAVLARSALAVALSACRFFFREAAYSAFLASDRGMSPHFGHFTRNFWLQPGPPLLASPRSRYPGGYQFGPMPSCCGVRGEGTPAGSCDLGPGHGLGPRPGRSPLFEGWGGARGTTGHFVVPGGGLSSSEEVHLS